MRHTRQKDLILQIVSQNYSHPTAKEIYDECKQVIPDISLGTIYRNLNILVNKGEIKRLKMPNNVDRFDHVHNKHAHFICLKCGNIIDVMEMKLDSFTGLGSNKVIDYEINFKGVCEECLKKEGEI